MLELRFNCPFFILFLFEFEKIDEKTSMKIDDFITSHQFLPYKTQPAYYKHATP